MVKRYFNVIRAGRMIPIVMGASKEAYSLFGPEGSFIHVADFSGPTALGVYLQQLKNDSAAYNKYFEWVGTGYHYNTRTMCRVCSTLNYLRESGEKKDYSSEELQEFWNPGQCSAQQYEEMEGLEDSAYDDDDDDLFYEDEYVELEDSAGVNDHEGD